MQLQDTPQQRRGGSFAHTAGNANDAPTALPDEQVHLAIEWHLVLSRHLQIWRRERYGRVDEHHIRVDEVLFTMLPQDKTDGKTV
jgi:hypothetical protein